MIYAIVHKPTGDSAVKYQGMSTDQITQMLAEQGFTVDFVDQAAYDAWLITHTAPAQTPAQILSDLRDGAVGSLTDQGSNAKFIRAVLLTLFDENNVMRQWITSFKSAVSLSTSLADLKTRVAALPNMPDRTVAQAKTAVQNKINAGDAD